MARETRSVSEKVKRQKNKVNFFVQKNIGNGNMFTEASGSIGVFANEAVPDTLFQTANCTFCHINLMLLLAVDI